MDIKHQGGTTMKEKTLKTMDDSTMEATRTQEADPQVPSNEPDPNWAHDALQELEDWIESQGVYIRQ